MNKILMKVAALLLAGPVAQLSAAPINFSDVSSASGIEEVKVSLTPPQSGAGIAVLDLDGNGTLDLIVAGGKNRPMSVFLGNGDLTFTEIPHQLTGLAGVEGDQRGVHLADFDNDGDQDVFLANWDINTPSRLFRNDGGVFTDISAQAGVMPLGTAVCGAWGDYDNDGFLDLFVTRYWGEANILYHNNGDGTFSVVNQAAGMPAPTAKDNTLSFQAVWIDVDRDGRPDLHVMNDRCYQGMKPNQVWRNNGDGTFKESGAQFGMNICLDSMGIGIADYNHDGFLDYFVSNVYYGHYFMEMGCGGAVDMTEATGTSAFQWGWGVIFSDLDYDSWPDLYVATAGYVTGQKPNFLFHNLGDGTFADISLASGGNGGNKDSGVVVRADLDGDGDDDLVIGQLFDTQGYVVLRNDTQVGHSFRLKLVGTASNRDGLGAWVQLFAGGKRFVQNRHDGETFSGGNEQVMVFGLGETSAVDRVVIHWPSGAVQIIDNPTLGETLVATEEHSGETFPPPWGEFCGDGIDNDCNGQVDEGFNVGALCTVGVGACLAAGWTICGPFGHQAICSATPGEPQEEILDGVDNDCDGVVDNPPPGGWPAVCIDYELCGDGADNDCNGLIDEGFEQLGTPCVVGLGECASEGSYVCAPGLLTLICDAHAEEPKPEQCNGMDDNCDGQVDEGFSVGQLCAVEFGDCLWTGRLKCAADGQGAICEVLEGEEALWCTQEISIDPDDVLPVEQDGQDGADAEITDVQGDSDLDGAVLDGDKLDSGEQPSDAVDGGKLEGGELEGGELEGGELEGGEQDSIQQETVAGDANAGEDGAPADAARTDGHINSGDEDSAAIGGSEIPDSAGGDEVDAREGNGGAAGGVDTSAGANKDAAIGDSSAAADSAEPTTSKSDGGCSASKSAAPPGVLLVVVALLLIRRPRFGTRYRR